MDTAILHDAWVLFVGIFSFFFKQFTEKLVSLDKNKADADAIKMHNQRLHEIDRRLDQLGATGIGRQEHKGDVTLLHQRLNDLEQRKADRVSRIDVKMKE